MKSWIIVLFFIMIRTAYGQDLLDLIDDKAPEKEFITNAFKGTRIINTQSTEMLGPGTLDFRIAHRFGQISGGVSNFFGLDQASMRLSFDYGLTRRIMIGVGRSNVNREIDGLVKYRLLWQATGPRSSPVSFVLIAGSTINTMPQDVSRVNFFSSRMAYYFQAAISRKFSERLTLQLTPGIVHYNLIAKAADKNDIPSVGVGGRVKLTKRIALTADYQYVIPQFLSGDYENYAGIGMDIETGGHVFQLHFSNSVGMNERAFITNTTGKISKMQIRFGFNLSRVFTVVRNNRAG